MKSDDDELKAMTDALAALQGLEPETQGRVLRWLAEKLKVAGAPALAPDAALSSTPVTLDKTTTPKQFLAVKKPRTDVERIVCLAYFLTHMRDTPHFKTRDLTLLNTEAAGLKFSNAAVTAKNATRQNNYLTGAGKGNKQITTLGEAVVEALPDREAVAKALAEHPKRKRKPGPKRKSAAAK